MTNKNMQETLPLACHSVNYRIAAQKSIHRMKRNGIINLIQFTSRELQCAQIFHELPTN